MKPDSKLAWAITIAIVFTFIGTIISGSTVKAFEITLQSLSDFAVAVAAILGILYAADWRHEFFGRSKVELAERIKRYVLRLEKHLKCVDSFIHLNEGETERKAYNSYIGKMLILRELQKELDELEVDAEIYLFDTFDDDLSFLNSMLSSFDDSSCTYVSTTLQNSSFDTDTHNRYYPNLTHDDDSRKTLETIDSLILDICQKCNHHLLPN